MNRAKRAVPLSARRRPKPQKTCRDNYQPFNFGDHLAPHRMLKLPAIFRRKRRVAEESDFGRRFGWFIERGGERIGELDYMRWDSNAQFWHEYRTTWRSPEDAVVGPDAWVAAKLVLRNRRYTEVVVDSFLTSPERVGGVIAVRGAHVPEELL